MLAGVGWCWLVLAGVGWCWLVWAAFFTQESHAGLCFSRKPLIQYCESIGWAREASMTLLSLRCACPILHS